MTRAGAPARPARRALAVAAAGLLPLFGCTVGPTYRPPPDPEARGYRPGPPPGVTASAPAPGGAAQRFSGSKVSERWWTLFGSAALDRLVERALAANPDVRAAKAALRAARENRLAARGALYPQAQAEGNGGRAKNPAALASPLANNAEYYELDTAQLSIAYAPDLFGGVRRQIEAAAATERNQRFQLEAAYLTLTTNVVVAAVQEASLKAQVRAAERSVTLAERLRDQLRASRDAGESASGDVAAQEATLAQARAAVPPLERQLAQAQDLLATLTGGRPDQATGPDLDLDDLTLPTELPLALPSELVHRRPDILAAEANLQGASAGIGVAVANRLPSVTLTAALGAEATSLSSLFEPGSTLWSLTAGVAQPVFAGGALRHRERAARAAYDQAAAQYLSTVHAAFQSVADTLAALETDARALQAAAAARQASATSLRLNLEAFRAGEVGSAAVLNAEASEAAAALAEVQARTARLTDTAALFQALGGGWREEASPPSDPRAPLGGAEARGLKP